MPRVIASADQLDFDLRATPTLPPFRGALMADPAHYDICYVINPFMAGNVGRVDHARARAQWEALADTFRALGLAVQVLPAAPGLPDLVFAANQSFPALLPDGSPAAVLSRMASEVRRGEVPLFERWYTAHGVRTLHLDAAPEVCFEGTGDALWLPGHRVILGGWGHRTSREAWPALARLLDVPILAFELRDPRFYHIDTCLSLLSADTALVVEEAFTPQALALLRAAIPTLRPLPIDEAVDRMSCNGWCPDGRHYVVQQGAPRTRAIVEELGLQVIEVETSEFLKSGGSVWCMKGQDW